MTSQDNLEIEVKLLLENLPALRERLVELGGTLVKPRVFERNIRYDNAWDGLARKQAILRLRQDSEVRITYKGVPKDVDISQAEVRIREELEITVDDFDTAHLLIQRIGFEPRQVYEKYRETFQLGTVEIVLDEMPYGDFIELEGGQDAIQQAANDLGLDWGKRILTNYLGLLTELNALHNLSINDLTFENFEGLSITASDLF